MFCYEKRLDSLVFCFDPSSLQSLNKCEKLNQMVLSSSSGDQRQIHKMIFMSIITGQDPVKYLVSIAKSFSETKEVTIKW